MYQSGIPMEAFSDSDFVYLTFMYSRQFSFINEDQLFEFFKNIDAYKFTFLFKFLETSYLKSYDLFLDEKNGEDRFLNHNWTEWLDLTETRRKEEYDHRVELLVKNPNTPIEILWELFFE